MDRLNKNSNTIFIDYETAKSLSMEKITNVFVGNKEIPVEQITPTSKSFCVPLIVSKSEVFLTDYNNNQIKSDFNYRSNFIQNISRIEEINKWNSNINIVLNEVLLKKGFDSDLRFDCVVNDHVDFSNKTFNKNKKIAKYNANKSSQIRTKIANIQNEINSLIEVYKNENKDLNLDNENDVVDYLYKGNSNKFKTLDKIHSLQFAKEKLVNELAEIKISSNSNLEMDYEQIVNLVNEIYENFQNSKDDQRIIGICKNKIKQIIFTIQKFKKDARDSGFEYDQDGIYSLLYMCKEILDF